MPKTFRQELEKIFNDHDIDCDSRRQKPCDCHESRYIEDVERAVRELIERAKSTKYKKTLWTFLNGHWGRGDRDRIPMPEGEAFNRGIDEYHSNLLAEINGSPDKEGDA